MIRISTNSAGLPEPSESGSWDPKPRRRALFPWALTVTLTWATVAAIIYAYLDLNVSKFAGRAAICCLYGFSLGAVPALLMRPITLLDRRNVRAMALLGCAVSLYFAWVVWICALLDSIAVQRHFSWLDLAKNPRTLGRLILSINQNGAYVAHSIDVPSHVVKGDELWKNWSWELVGTFGGAIVAVNRLGRRFAAVADRLNKPPPPLTPAPPIHVSAPTDVRVTRSSESSIEDSPTSTSCTAPAAPPQTHPPDSDIGVV